MKRLLLAVLLVGVLAVQAGTITQAERARAVKDLEASSKAFLASINGLTPEQWNFKPDENTWSIAECAEHITLSEEFILELITKRVLPSPAIESTAEMRARDEMIVKSLYDRSKKFKAPEMIQPTHQWPDSDSMAKEFTARRARTIEFARSTQEDLRAHAVPHPVFQQMDAYQWVLLIAGHSGRHTAQIEEVKTHANYPKK
jgi:uncharacterized damage-inducible protein DinB